VSVYVVRHAKAGSRRAWSGDDELRPLSKRGRAQARAIAKRLGGTDISRVVSSPYVRCVETVEPLAQRLGLLVETSNALAEGAMAADAVLLLEKCGDDDVVLCTHGDVLGNLLVHAERQGVELGDERIEKASVWELEVVDGAIRSARYEPPPGA
jgi:broad specificity phosphatase PhoE